MSTIFVTTNLGLAAALSVTGYPVHRITRDETGYASFELVSDGGIDAAIGDFWARRVPVDARTLLDAHRAIREEMRATPKGGAR